MSSEFLINKSTNCELIRLGLADAISAATPDATGLENEVPLHTAYWLEP